MRARAHAGARSGSVAAMATACERLALSVCMTMSLAAGGADAVQVGVVGLDFMTSQPGPGAPPAQPGPRGNNLLGVVGVDLETGNVTHTVPPFFTNDTANGYSCIQAFRPTPPTYYIISSFEPVKLITVDAQSGIATTVTLSEQLVVFDVSWSMSFGGVIYAYAAVPPYQLTDVGIFIIDPTTGIVGKNLGGLDITGYAEPRACESGLTLSESSDPRFYFTVATNKKDPDDGDQALLTYDLKKQKVVSQVPWSVKNGSLNAMLSMTLPGATTESVLAIATDPDDNNPRPLELVSIDPWTGAHTVLAGVPVEQGPLIPSLGSLAANREGSSLITIVMDDPTAEFFSITFDLSNYSRTGMAKAVRRPLTQQSNLWNLQYVERSDAA